jgi:thiamine-monophosphate kinase
MDCEASGGTVSAGGEAAVIALARRAAAGRPAPGVRAGIGDDAAVLEPVGGHALLVSQDMLVERVHFRCDWTRPEWLGRKAVAVNVSDIAAMGGRPTALVTALALPPELPLAWVDAFFEGFAAAAAEYGAALVGGDTVRSPGPVVIDVTVLGTAARPVLRRGAVPGDALLVTGTLGLAHAGWRLLERGVRWPGATPAEREALERHFLPRARVGAGLVLADCAHALTDISDGLWQEAGALAAGGPGTVLDVWRLPVSDALRAVAGSRAPDWALGGGEDYELLAAVPSTDVEVVSRRLEAEGTAVHVVGFVDDGPGVRVRMAPEDTPRPWVPPSGSAFEHFAGAGDGHE